jgi:hypothetical protein
MIDTSKQEEHKPELKAVVEEQPTAVHEDEPHIEEQTAIQVKED